MKAAGVRPTGTGLQKKQRKFFGSFKQNHHKIRCFMQETNIFFAAVMGEAS